MDCPGIIGKVVGIACWRENKIPEIIDIMVSPEEQGRGYGKILLNEALSRLKSKGYQKVLLGVFESNLVAGYLYKKLDSK